MFATLPVSSSATLLAAALDRFLVFGIFANLAIIKDKVLKMFLLLRVNYLRSQSNDSTFTSLKRQIVGPVLEAAFSQQERFPQRRKFVGFLLPVKLLLSINTLFA